MADALQSFAVEAPLAEEASRTTIHRRTSMTPRTLWTVVVGAVPWAMACGSSVPTPHDQWADAQANLGRAQMAGAPEVPMAKLHMRLAQEDLQKAKELMEKDNKRAASLSALANSEAQLAISLAKAAASQEEARNAEFELQYPNTSNK
jgi:hypothetical protein